MAARVQSCGQPQASAALDAKARPTPADQGSQFTSDSFTGVLVRNGITISMDGRGRALDNIFVERLWRTVKYEDVYLKKYESMQDLLMGLTHYFVFHNEERLHQSLDYQTPGVVYRTAVGGGAKIVDKFGGALETSSTVALLSTEDNVSSAKELGQRHAAGV